MQAKDPGPSLFLSDWEGRDDFTQARLRWLTSLRWIAMAGVLVATVLARLGFFPGVSWPVLGGVAVFGSLYNFLLQRSQREGSSPVGRRAALLQAVVDLGMLTAVLWSAGGIASPFLGYYVFHVALIAILGGPRAAVVAAMAAVVFAGLLSLSAFYPELGVAEWNPTPPWDTVADVVAFVTTLGGVTYIVAHSSREIRDREQAILRARDRAALEYQLLSNTLNELEAGLEVIDASGNVVFSNKRAEELGGGRRANEQWVCPGKARPCESDADGVCPVTRALEDGVAGRCRFAAPEGDGERVYELLSFPLAPHGEEPPRLMNLYVDRTQAVLAERRLLLAERLASLGRIAQGVAHELNTPLATIRTLATDMRDALAELLRTSDAEAKKRTIADLDESATLIRDETKRLGRITHSLLAGGDLARAHIHSGVALLTVVERARALVAAGTKSSVVVRVDASLAGVEAEADPDRLMQVLVNLLQNAADALRMGGGSSIEVRAERDEAMVRLVVEDDGPGVDPRIEGRLFEPFATTKPPGEGTGLGLYTSWMLAQGMGGDLELENRVDAKGARAVLTLPNARRSSLLAADSIVAQRLSE